jgi:hypothetical protein
MTINPVTQQPHTTDREFTRATGEPGLDDEVLGVKLPGKVPAPATPQDVSGPVPNTETDWYEP